MEDDAGPKVPDEERITAREVWKPQPWVITVGYRYQESFRHFVGTVEQKQREVLGTQIRNTYHLFDVAVERQITSRFSLTGSLPILFAYRNQLYNPRGEFRVNGIGDMGLGLGERPRGGLPPLSLHPVCGGINCPLVGTAWYAISRWPATRKPWDSTVRYDRLWCHKKFLSPKFPRSRVSP
ncbi:MAG: hypothetical protein IPP47_15375 [Bryobacterales bacterium]|nr:hypothetical protein [Bryobacterales bacterium]